MDSLKNAAVVKALDEPSKWTETLPKMAVYKTQVLVTNCTSAWLFRDVTNAMSKRACAAVHVPICFRFLCGWRSRSPREVIATCVSSCCSSAHWRKVGLFCVTATQRDHSKFDVKQHAVRLGHFFCCCCCYIQVCFACLNVAIPCPLTDFFFLPFLLQSASSHAASKKKN